MTPPPPPKWLHQHLSPSADSSPEQPIEAHTDTPPVQLTHLDEDLLLTVLSYCDVLSLIAVRRVCQTWYQLLATTDDDTSSPLTTPTSTIAFHEYNTLHIDPTTPTSMKNQHYTTTLLQIPSSALRAVQSLHLIGDSLLPSWLIGASRLSKLVTLKRLIVDCNCSKFNNSRVSYTSQGVGYHRQEPQMILPGQVEEAAPPARQTSSQGTQTDAPQLFYNHGSRCVAHMLFASLPKNSPLTYLCFRACHQPLPTYRLQVLQHLTALKLDYTEIRDSNCLHIGRILSLKFLSLRHTYVTDIALHYLKHNTALHSLDLTATQLKGHTLSLLQACPDLHILRLSECVIDDVGLVQVSALTGLEWLDVSDSKCSLQWSEQSRLNLGEKLQQLKALNMRSAVTTSDDDILCRNLVRQLPQLKLYECGAVHDRPLSDCHLHARQPSSMLTWHMHSEMLKDVNEQLHCQQCTDYLKQPTC